MFYKILVISLIFYSTIIVATTKSCDTLRGYEFAHQTRHCYKFHATAMPWLQARKNCKSEGADLAVINSDAEAQFLVDLYKKYPNTEIKCRREFCATWWAAIGFYYLKEEDEFVTIKGETVEEAGYDKWFYKTKRSHGYFLREGNITDWDGTTDAPFICEIEPAV